MFFNGSRYQRVLDATWSDEAGTTLTLKRTRELATTQAAVTYQVRTGDRLDALAQKFYHDPRKWWLIADANPDVLTPEQLLEPGTQLVIPRDRNV